jgi:hypothetical protein
MGRKFSEKEPVATPKVSRIRDPIVFIVSSDGTFLKSVLSQASGVPEKYAAYRSLEQLMEALSETDRMDVAFALVVEKSGEDVDTVMLRQCKLDHPELNYVILLENCDQKNFLRFHSIGVQNIILPPFSDVDLAGEIATALPNIPQFKRHPDLMRRGLVRLDFLIPSDLSYVLGVNYIISMLLKEFRL